MDARAVIQQTRGELKKIQRETSDSSAKIKIARIRARLARELLTGDNNG